MTTFETREQVASRRSAAEADRRKQIQANFKRSIPKEATLQFVVTSEQLSPKPSTGKYGTQEGAGCPSYLVRVAPLAVEDDIGSVQTQFETTLFLTLPLVNTAIEDHLVPNVTTNEFIRELLVLAPEKFQKIDKGNSTDGWKNDPETRAAINAQSQEAEFLAADLVSGAAKIGDVTFYGDVKPKANGNGYYIRNKSPDLGDRTFSAPEEA